MRNNNALGIFRELDYFEFQSFIIRHGGVIGFLNVT